MTRTFLTIAILCLADDAAAQSACAPGDTCFIAFGDQGTGKPEQMRVAGAMTRWAADPQTRTDFVIGLGDNFYEVGVHSCTSSKFTKRFEEPYADIAKEFFMSLGNHDIIVVTSKGNHQVCYAREDAARGTPKWVMPDFYYTFTKGDVQFFVLFTPGLTLQDIDWHHDAKHLQWLDTELGRSRARWKIVYGHGPIFSYGSHGHSKKLADKLLPLLAKHRVDAYFAGHEHNQQHLRHPAYPDTEFIVSGAAGKHGTRGRGELALWASPDLGFVYVVASRDELAIRFVTVDGRGNARTQHIAKRRKQSGRAPIPPPLECAEPSKEKSMGRCYPRCRTGFKGVGPRCYKLCPEGYHDDGLTCRRDVEIKAKGHYGRGAGYVLWDRDKCEREHRGGCEKHGALWYPKCKRGYRAVGCCICREHRCPRGFRDDGATCRRDTHIFSKQSYGRGMGTGF